MTLVLPPETAVEGRFGPYGGRYVPETLVAALDDLAALYDSVRTDPSFWGEYQCLLMDVVGRPSRLTEAPRFSAALPFREFIPGKKLSRKVYPPN